MRAIWTCLALCMQINICTLSPSVITSRVACSGAFRFRHRGPDDCIWLGKRAPEWVAVVVVVVAVVVAVGAVVVAAAAAVVVVRGGLESE